MEPELWQLLGDGAADDEVAAIIRLGQQGVIPSGVRVLTQFGDIITVRLRRSDIPRLNSAAEVAVMEAGDTYFAPDLEPHLEGISETLPLTPQNTDERRSPSQQATGRGVVIGVVDWGFDFAHPDFRNKDGTTRILALWDQRTSQKPGAPQPFGYGTLHDREAINAALRQSDPYKALGYHPADADTGIGCHATHVASIAAGSGGPARPTGVAPEADLVFVQNAPWGENTSEKLGDSVTLLEAIDFIFRTAGDRPCVINLSMGRHGEQHDGTTLIEQGLDAALRAAPGRAICMSNGNYFDKRIHAFGQLRSTEHRDLIWEVNEKGTTYNEVEIWYSWRDRITAELRGPNDTLIARIGIGERVTLSSGGVEVGKAYHRAQEPNNLDNHIDIYLYKTAPAGSWTIRLTALDVVDGRFHAWIERDGLCPQCQARFRPEDAVRTCTTGTICNGLRTIAVGAYDNHDEDRRIAHFSSCGPTRDGRLKPDLCAPGVSVLAARSAPRDPKGEVPLLTRMSGTSMAAPCTTGAVALMFEVAPRRLRIEETHNLLLQSAERVTVHDEVPDRVGIGFLDIDAAVKAAQELPDRGLTPTPKSHVPAAAPAPQPPAPIPAALRVASNSQIAADLTERSPRFGESALGEVEITAPQRPSFDTGERSPPFDESTTGESEISAPQSSFQMEAGEYAEVDGYACDSVLSPAGQARRIADIRRGRNPRPQIAGGKPLCPGETHIVRNGSSAGTIDLLAWNFDIDGSYLKTQHEAALDQLIAAVHSALRGTSPSAASYTIQLSGFASRTGAADYNAALATEREDAVQAYLLANWEKFTSPSEAPIAPHISFARNPGGFDPAAPLGRESAQSRSARVIAVPAGAPVPPPRPFPKRCGTLTVWINAFIPHDVSGYTFTVPAGPHSGKTAIPCPPIALPANPHCLSRGYLTDQRDFSDLPSAGVRMRSIAEIALAPPRLVDVKHVTSGTTEFDKTTGAVTCVESADMSRCSFSDFRVEPEPLSGNYTIKLKVKGAASDPCVNLAADIDYEGEISVFCSPRGNIVEVSFAGRIDSFPAFEMYANLNGVTRALFQKPPPPGNTVANLLGGASTPVAGRVRFEACHLGEGDAQPTGAEAEALGELDPTSLILGIGLASQLSRPVPNPQAQPASVKPEPDAQATGGDAAASADAEAVETLTPESVTVAEAKRPEQTLVERPSDSFPAITELAAPAAIFDAVTFGRDPVLLGRIGQCCLLVAGPGEPLTTELRSGDLIVRRAMGEPGPGHVFTVVDATLLRREELPQRGVRGEDHGGWLVQVAEPRRGLSSATNLCRAALDGQRRVPFDQVILRPFGFERAQSAGETAAEGRKAPWRQTSQPALGIALAEAPWVPREVDGAAPVEGPPTIDDLTDAIARRDTNQIQALISGGVDVNAIDKNGATPLTLAAKSGDPQIAQVLLNNGARVDGINRDHETPLIVAAQSADKAMSNLLLNNNAFINAQDLQHRTPLYISVEKARLDMVTFLLGRRDVDPDVPADDGQTPLMKAASNGSESIVTILIQNGANVNKTSDFYRTALMEAALAGQSKIVRLLLSRHADADRVDKFGQNALLEASRSGNAEVAKAILEKTADVNHQDQEGRTALMEAAWSRFARKGNVDVVKVLVQNPKIDVNLKDKNGTTALIAAARGGDPNIVNAILQSKHKVELNSQDAAGRTALMEAISSPQVAKTGNADIVKVLIRYHPKPDLDLQDRDGKTALIEAVSYGELEAVRALVAAGAKLDIADNNKDTALSIARSMVISSSMPAFPQILTILQGAQSKSPRAKP
jgi:ankyrin repeat protein/subtilisin family serine protease/outer membrane protein OmpA-like peptidoglycan-associated protein